MIPDLCCVICQKRTSIRYYFCTEHLSFRDSKAEWLRFLVRNSAAERMRWLSRSRSKTKMSSFSDLSLSDQRRIGLEVDLSAQQ